MNNLILHRQIKYTEPSKLFLYKPDFDYKLTKNIKIGIGYWYIKTRISAENSSIASRKEHRIWEYIKYNIPFNTFELSTRLAFEQRMKREIESNNNDLTINQSPYSQRLRYRLNITFNLFCLANNKTIKATISEEVRMRFTSGLNNPIFGQNNTYLYLFYDLSAHTSLRLGYGVDYSKVNSEVYRENNAFRFRLNYYLDLRKRQ